MENKILTFRSRAPGRVNLIGNHIDFNGFSVLPMALEKATEFFVTVRRGVDPDCTNIYLSNEDPETFPGSFKWRWFAGESYNDIELHRETFMSLSQEKESGNDWSKYVYAGFETFWKQKLIHNEQLYNFGYDIEIKVSSNLPIASGLSSSAALLCATMLAVHVIHTMQAHRVDESAAAEFGRILSENPPMKERYSEWCQKAENSLGMMCGGMDFAISMLGEEGFAKHISFNPLIHRSVKLPETMTIVVANSLILNKKLSSDRFNRRVMECRLGSTILAKKFNVSGWNEAFLTPGQLQKKLGKTLPEMIEIVEEALSDRPFTIEEVGTELGMDTEQVFSTYFQNIRLTDESLRELKLRRRLLHAFSEAHRVHQFIEGCENTQLSHSEKAQLFKRVFEEGHRSCRENFETSVPELDQLIQLNSSVEGVIASKFCGAGFGGITISIVDSTDPSTVEKVIDEIWKRYYECKFVENPPLRSNVLFQSRPSPGARIILDFE